MNASFFLHQFQHSEKVLKRFNMMDRNAVFPFKEMIGSFLYLSVISRPDISFAVGVLCRCMQNPSQIHISVSLQFITTYCTVI